MKTQIIITVLSALGAGAVGAVVAGGNGTSDATPASGSVIAQVGEMQSSIDSLRAENARLLERLNSLENRPAAIAPTRVDAEAPTSAEVAAIQEDLSALAAAMRDPNETLPQNFRLQISNVLEDIRDQEEKDKQEAREKRDAERKEEKFQEIVAELNLNAYQANQLRTTVDSATEQMKAARELLMESRDWDGMRGAMDEMKESVRTDLSRYLTPEQVSTMDDKYMSGRGSILGGGRGGFGGGGGRGGRGG